MPNPENKKPPHSAVYSLHHQKGADLLLLGGGDTVAKIPCLFGQFETEPASFRIGRMAVSIVSLSEDGEHFYDDSDIGDGLMSIRRKLTSQYGIFRFIQLFLSFIELGLVLALIAVDKDYRIYTIWLIQIPLLSISTGLVHLFSPKCRVNNGFLPALCSEDMFQAALFLAQAVVIVLFYMYIWAIAYWASRSDFFLPVATAASVFCVILSLVFWVIGCSSAFCHCLGNKRVTILVTTDA